MDLEMMVGIFADLGEQVGQTNKHLGAMIEPKPVHKPVGNSLVQSSAAPSPVLLEINDTPNVGKMWYVTQIGVLGTDGHTAVSGAIADVYIGPSPDAISGTPVTDFQAQIISGATIPTIANYGHHDKPIHSHEHIYVLLYGILSGQPIELVAHVDEYNVSEVERMHTT